MGRVESEGDVIWKALDGENLGSNPSGKVFLPDPVTFAELCDDRFYGNREKLFFAYCDALAGEIKTLAKHGIAYLQFSAPGLVARFRSKPVSKQELGQALEAIRSCLRGASLRSGYHTYFGDAAPYLPYLLEKAPTNDVGVDLTETDVRSLHGSKKGIIAGVANSRSSYVEGPGEIVENLEGLRDGFSRVILAPSADLQHVPRAIADSKLRSLSEAKLRLSGGER